MSITSVAPVIDSTGITAPSYEDILEYLYDRYRGIFGADVYIDPDSQDGQWIAVLAEAMYDCGSVSVMLYRSFSPATGTGSALSSNVKINGISRAIATYSTVDLSIGGTVGTTITNGSVQDSNGNLWSLPASVTIPAAGIVTVTATAQQAGAISADAGTITTISTPTRGWQTVTNPNDSALGAPVETDATLRQRQAVSTAVPSRSVLEGIVGVIAAITGVTRYAPYENDTNVTDSNGIPSHSISMVVEGGDAVAIAQAISAKKGPGTGTYGNTIETIYNVYDIPQQISFSRPTYRQISVAVNLRPLAGYTSTTGVAVQQAIVDYINAAIIGGIIEWDSAVAAAKSVSLSNTFRLASLTLSSNTDAGNPDVVLDYDEAAQTSIANVTLTTS